MVLNLSNVSTTMINGVIYRDLVYTNSQGVTWNLGLLRTIELEVYIDSEPNPIPFPINNPLNLSFKILHLAI